MAETYSAKLKILSYIQSSAEWLLVLQNVTPYAPDTPDTPLQSVTIMEGQKRLLKSLGVTQIEKLKSTETEFIDEDKALIVNGHYAYNESCRQIMSHWHVTLETAKQCGVFEVLDLHYHTNVCLRKRALRWQAVTPIKIDIDMLKELRHQASEKLHTREIAYTEYNNLINFPVPI